MRVGNKVYVQLLVVIVSSRPRSFASRRPEKQDPQDEHRTSHESNNRSDDHLPTIILQAQPRPHSKLAAVMVVRLLFFLALVSLFLLSLPRFEGAPLPGDYDPEKLYVHLVPHTHDDVGWQKTVDEYYYGGNLKATSLSPKCAPVVQIYP